MFVEYCVVCSKELDFSQPLLSYCNYCKKDHDPDSEVCKKCKHGYVCKECEEKLDIEGAVDDNNNTTI